jgi:hypothetical protein
VSAASKGRVPFLRSIHFLKAFFAKAFFAKAFFAKAFFAKAFFQIQKVKGQEEGYPA